MPKTLLTVATRKGAFIFESEDRRDWKMRGPFCEGWPVYHAIYDATTGEIYAAAASEWHGSAVWRSKDLGETWEHSSEGLAYGDGDGRKISKVSTLARAGDRRDQARLQAISGGCTRGVSAERFETPLVGGAARFWRRGGNPPAPAFPQRGKRERGALRARAYCLPHTPMPGPTPAS
jgi:hypothetical protein